MAIFVGAGIFWGYLLPAGRPEQSWDWVKRIDPPLGSRFQLVEPSSTPTLLVVAGDCLSCTANAFDPQAVETPTKCKTVILIQAQTNNLPQGLKNPAFEVVEDTLGMEQKLHAPWTPRWYWFDADGSLSDTQSDPTDMRVGR